MSAPMTWPRSHMCCFAPRQCDWPWRRALSRNCVLARERAPQSPKAAERNRFAGLLVRDDALWDACAAVTPAPVGNTHRQRLMIPAARSGALFARVPVRHGIKMILPRSVNDCNSELSISPGDGSAGRGQKSIPTKYTENQCDSAGLALPGRGLPPAIS